MLYSLSRTFASVWATRLGNHFRCIAPMLRALPLFALMCLFSPNLFAGEPIEYAPSELLIQYQALTPLAARGTLEKKYQLKLLSHFPHLNVIHYRISSSANLQNVIEALRQEPFVEVVEPNYLKRLNALPQDEFLELQWSIQDTGQVVNGVQGAGGFDIALSGALDQYTSVEQVIVAVLDSGVALDHPDIRPRIWSNSREANGIDGVDDDNNGYIDDWYGWDFIDGGGLPLDENGHGTLVASQIAAESGNTLGMVGVAPDAEIMTLRIADDFGRLGFPRTSVANVIAATSYAVNNGARVINASFGGPSYSVLEEKQLTWVDRQGVLFVAAAGNGGTDGLGDNNDSTPSYPASYSSNGIISVAALNRWGELAGFSNFGVSSVDIAAPGTNIFGAYITRSGHFLETFEQGAVGWTQGPEANNASSYRWGLWRDSSDNTWLSDSFDPVTNAPTNYLSNTDIIAQMPAVDLRSISGPQLQFDIYYDLEYFFDLLVIEGSNDGVTWDFLDFETGTSIFGFKSTKTIDISRYEGTTAYFRFRLITDSFVNRDGVYIDNVSISKVDVFNYNGNQWKFLNGTSFAAPLVSGVAALIMSARPDISHRQVRAAILTHGLPLAELDGQVASGSTLNAASALSAALQLPPDTDRDGVADPNDNCPNTSEGRAILENGCAFVNQQLGSNIDGAVAEELAGYAVALSRDGSVLAAGARTHSVDGLWAGAARVYRWDGELWHRLGRDIRGENAFDYAGQSIALSGDGLTIAIGSPGNDVNGDSSGYVRVYSWDGQAWIQIGASIYGEAAGDEAGYSVALSDNGHTLAIGAPYNDGNGTNSGHVRVYRRGGSTWNQVGIDLDGKEPFNESGNAIALSRDGNTIVIGARHNDGRNGVWSGHARVYSWDGNDWQKMGGDIDGEAAFDYAGIAVDISDDGQVVAVGAHGNDDSGSRAGQVRLYRWRTVDWQQIGFDIDGGTAGEESGFSVSLSGDGTLVATGAPKHNSVGLATGAVRLFQIQEDTWVQVGSAITGEAQGDEFGYAVGLAADGSRVAIGSPVSAGSGTSGGYTKVFSIAAQDSDEDFTADTADPFPLDANEFLDTDGDGVGNNADQDDDNDGVPDTTDALPLDPTESQDSDNDGVGDNSDPDIDNDGVPNDNDPFPFDPREMTDTDGDGIGDNADPDDDNDSVPDQRDAFPLDPTESQDTDGDGVGDERDLCPNTSLSASVLANGCAFVSEVLQLGLDINGVNSADENGYSTALSGNGNVLAVGAVYHDSRGTRSGQVRIYTWTDTGWDQLGGDLYGADPFDFFGAAIAISEDGSVIAIGAPGDDTNGNRAGKVTTFRWSGATWEQFGSAIYGDVANDNVGNSLSLSRDGKTVAIGAPTHSTNGDNAGRVRVYSWNGADWQQRGSAMDGELGDRMGSSVALSGVGTRIAIGAYGHRNRTGKVAIYEWSESSWQQLGWGIEGEAIGDFSDEVALSTDGNTVAIGAAGNDSGGNNRGHIRIYRWINNVWQQMGADLDGATDYDLLGWSVRLSSDGNILAAGAIQTDAASKNTGYTLLFRWNGHLWQSFGDALVGTATGDESGYSLGLSDDGTRLAIGAPGNDNRGDRAGLVRVFSVALQDSDEDGVADSVDAFPLDASESADTDGDGVGDNADAFPANPLETADTDADGLGDNFEVALGTSSTNADSDGDGFTDGEEVDSDSDPINPEDYPVTKGLPIWLLLESLHLGKSSK